MIMEKSNLKLYSNIYPLESTWPLDQNFLKAIWDGQALQILEQRAKRKELQLTKHQNELLKLSLPCSLNNAGENPWGSVSPEKTLCRCRREECSRFKTCRNGRNTITEAQYGIWKETYQDCGGLARFDDIYNQTSRRVYASSRADIATVFGALDVNRTPPYADPVKVKPLIHSFPDDEKYY